VKKGQGVTLGTIANLSDVGRHKGGATTRSKAVEAHAAVEPMIMRLRAKGLSYAAIAERLNADGRTSRDGATPFSAMTVLRIAKRAEAREE
jgi:hypothetical protein